MTSKEMFEMRMNGATFQEIAEVCGTTKQAVHIRLKLYAKKLTGIRGQGFDISNIKFEGIYEHFKYNMDESLHSFAVQVYGYDNPSKQTTTMRNFLTGEHESRFNIRQIKKMCEICGKPFEEVFREREKTDSSVSLVDGHIDEKSFWKDTH